MSRKPPAYVYFTYFGFESTVIESQVLVPGAKLQERGISVHYIFMERIDKWLIRLFGGPLRKRYSRISTSTFYCLPRIPKNFLFLNAIILGLTLHVFFRGRKIFIHARGFQGTHVALQTRLWDTQIKILGDIRGVESAEFSYVNPKNTYWAHRLERIERNVLRRADRLTGVSNAMIRHFQSQPDSRKAAEMAYIPCCVDVDTFIRSSENRDVVRRRLNFSDKLVVAYAGQVSGWHRTDKIVEVVAKLAEMDPRIFFMGLSPGFLELKRRIQKYPILNGRSFLKRATFPEIPDLLAAADIGILLRDKNPLNTYACPTKFGEYLAAGLYVLTTNGVADLASYVQSENVGMILPLDSLENQEDRLRQVIRDAENENSRILKSQDLAKKVFTWDHYIPKMIENFSTVESTNK